MEAEVEAESYEFIGNVSAKEMGSSDTASAIFRSLVSRASSSICVGRGWAERHYEDRA